MLKKKIFVMTAFLGLVFSSGISLASQITIPTESVVEATESATVGDHVRETKPYTGIANGHNNFDEQNGYRRIIITYGTFGTDYFSLNHQPDATNRATEEYDIGTNLTINGIAIKDIKTHYSLTEVSYAHGNNFLFVRYPEEVLTNTDEYRVPTLEIVADTPFVDEAVGATKLYLVGSSWTDQSVTFTNNKDTYGTISDFGQIYSPHVFTKSTPVFVGYGLSYVNLKFIFNLGDVLSSGQSQLVLNSIYGNIITFQENAVYIIENGQKEPTENTLVYLPIDHNREYMAEIEVFASAGTVHFLIGLDHVVILDKTLNSFAATDSTWMVGVGQNVYVRDYEELHPQVPTFIVLDSYTFDEGDPVMDFLPFVTLFDLTDPTVNSTALQLTYSEGAVTDGHYNAGKHTLTYTLPRDGFNRDIVKTTTINVLGADEYCYVSFDGIEPQKVLVGEKIDKPTDPVHAPDPNYDYKFDGWYYNGSRWNFDKDVALCDMNLTPKFIQSEKHYIVNVSFEGLSKENASYSLTKGISVQPDLFSETGYTCKMYSNNVEIPYLVVTGDTSIRVVYSIEYVHHPAVEATCTEPGNVEYWTRLDQPGVYYGDNKGQSTITTIVVPALNHNYGVVTYSWSEDGSNCSAHIECMRNGCDHVINENANITGNITTPATCTTKGKTTYTATYTDSHFSTQTLVVEDVDMIDHDFNDWVSDDESMHSRTCKNCTEEEISYHSFVWVVTQTATTSQTGLRHKHCNVCGYDSADEIIPMITCDHSGSKTHTAQVDPTCEDNGTKDYYECDLCHRYFADEACSDEIMDLNTWKSLSESLLGGSIEGLGHDFGAWVSDNSTTHSHTCQRPNCHEKETENHSLKWVVTKPASKTETGLKHQECTECNYVGSDVVIEKIACDHSGKINKFNQIDATCEANGRKEYYQCNDCKRYFKDEYCLEEITDLASWLVTPVDNGGAVIAKLNHLYGTPVYVWSDDGLSCSAYVSCTREGCSHTISEIATVSQIGHVDPGCETKGLDTYKATFSNALFTEQTYGVDIPATGHDREHIAGVEAKFKTAGYLDYWHCFNCDLYYTDSALKNLIGDEVALNAWKSKGGAGYLAPTYKGVTAYDHIETTWNPMLLNDSYCYAIYFTDVLDGGAGKAQYNDDALTALFDDKITLNGKPLSTYDAKVTYMHGGHYMGINIPASTFPASSSEYPYAILSINSPLEFLSYEIPTMQFGIIYSTHKMIHFDETATSYVSEMWGNADYSQTAPDLNANNIPQSGYVALLQFSKNIPAMHGTGSMSLIDSSSDISNLGSHILINGNKIDDLDGVILGIFQGIYLYIYFPGTGEGAYFRPTIEILEGALINGVLLESTSIYCNLKMGINASSSSVWIKGEKAMQEVNYVKLEWNNKSYNGVFPDGLIDNPAGILIKFDKALSSDANIAKGDMHTLNLVETLKGYIYLNGVDITTLEGTQIKYYNEGFLWVYARNMYSDNAILEISEGIVIDNSILPGLTFKGAANEWHRAFTISFDSQGGTEINDYLAGDFESLSDIANANTPTKGKIQFNGWRINGEPIAQGAKVTEDVTMVADWLEEVTVTFANTTLSPVKIIKGQKVTKPADPTKENAHFDNWYKDAAFTEVYDFDSAVTGELTIYAKFKDCKDGAISYGDFTSDHKCTATIKCSVGGEILRQETATGVYVRDSAASCTQAEKGHYLYTFAEAKFKDQIEYVTIGTASGHKMVKTDKVNATCSVAGHKEYYQCTVCLAYFEDIQGNSPIANIITWLSQGGNGYLAPLGHKMTKISGQEATKEANGFKEAYKCANCNLYYEDEAGTRLIGNETAYTEWKTNGYGKIDKLPSGGCGGSIMASSLIGLLAAACAGIVLAKKKEDR